MSVLSLSSPPCQGVLGTTWLYHRKHHMCTRVQEGLGGHEHTGTSMPRPACQPLLLLGHIPTTLPMEGTQRLRSWNMMTEMTKQMVPQSLKKKSTLLSAFPSRCWGNPANSPVSCHGADGRSGSVFLCSLGLHQLHPSAPAQQSQHRSTQNSSSTLGPALALPSGPGQLGPILSRERGNLCHFPMPEQGGKGQGIKKEK